MLVLASLIAGCGRSGQEGGQGGFTTHDAFTVLSDDPPGEVPLDPDDSQGGPLVVTAHQKESGDAGVSADAQQQEATSRTAVVFFFTINVRAQPSFKSARMGYIRRGTLLRVDGPIDGPGCTGGWWRLVDTMGYVCEAEGLKFDNVEKYIEEAAPHLPWFDAVMPYDYGHITKNDLPAYNRIPTPEEEKEVLLWLAERRAVIEAQREAVEKALAEGTVLPNPYEIIAQVEAPDGTLVNKVVEDAYVQDVDEGPVPTEIPFGHVEKILLRGFYVSLNKKAYGEGSSWYKTLRGLYVKAKGVDVTVPPGSRGTELGGDLKLPVGIVIKKKIGAYSSDDGGGTIKPAKPLGYDRFEVLPIVEEVTTKGQSYYHVGGGMYVRRGDVRRVDGADPPQTVKTPGQKWIDVDIGSQVLLAYEGDTPVYVALVSTGREKQNLEFKTPRGIHSVVSKHVTGTMDNLYAVDGPYAIEDVPWTLYFLGSYALHGAFWHNGFGAVRSHGCINLTPWDARWIFVWSEPVLPQGWHSIYADKDRPGTIVKVHD